MELDEIASVFESADFFSICNDEQKRFLAFASEPIVLSADDILFSSGDVADGAYVLVGGVLVSTEDSGAENHVQEVDEIGIVIGEMGLMLTRPRRSTVQAKTDAELLFVSGAAFGKLMRQFPELAARAAKRIESELDAYLDAVARFKTAPGD